MSQPSRGLTKVPDLTMAVVLARGLGTRMRREDGAADLTAEQAEAADSGAKAMMPIGRPFLDHVISALADGGITDVCLVTGPEHTAIRAYYDGLVTERVRIHHAIQAEALGTANAVQAAEQVTGSRRFLVVNGDNYYASEVVAALAQATGNTLAGYDRTALVELSNIDADRVSAFALVEASDGLLVDILEKPAPAIVEAAGPHAMISMNCFTFTPRVYDACRAISPSARGEYEIVDAVRWLVAHDEPVTVVPVQSGVLDLSRRSDVVGVEQALRGRTVIV